MSMEQIKTLEELERRLWPKALAVPREVFEELCVRYPKYVDKNVDPDLPYLGVCLGIPLYPMGES